MVSGDSGHQPKINRQACEARLAIDGVKAQAVLVFRRSYFLEPPSKANLLLDRLLLVDGGQAEAMLLAQRKILVGRDAISACDNRGSSC